MVTLISEEAKFAVYISTECTLTVHSQCRMHSYSTQSVQNALLQYMVRAECTLAIHGRCRVHSCSTWSVQSALLQYTSVQNALLQYTSVQNALLQYAQFDCSLTAGIHSVPTPMPFLSLEL